MEKPQISESDFISTQINFLPHFSITALFAAISIGMLVWACWRTRSGHLFLRRFWRIFFGRIEIKDKKIRNFISNLDDLISFRMFSGVMAKNLTEARIIIKWSKKNNEELTSIGACGDFFDTESCMLKNNEIPKEWVPGSLIIPITLLAFLSAFFLWAATTDDAILQMKDSGFWFKVSGSRARIVFHQATVSHRQCSDEAGRSAIRQIGFSEKEVQALCYLTSQDDGSKEFIDDARQEQISVGIILIPMLIWAIKILGTYSWTSLNAIRMRERLAKAASADVTIR